MSELAEFLTARYDEREAVARSLEGETWAADTYVGDEYNHGIVTGPNGERIADCGTTHFDDGTERATHIALNDPARELRRIAGLRRIVAAHSDQHECADYEATQWPYRGCAVLRNLTVEFADHPGYKQEWKP